MFKITERAVEFYKNEMDLKSGDTIKLFVRYGGGGIDGFTLGVERGETNPPSIKETVNGIGFYYDPEDDWLISQALIDLDGRNDEIKLTFNQ